MNNSTESNGMSAIILFTVIGVIAYADRLILGTLFAPLQEELGLTASELGVLQGASFAIVYAASGLFIGRAADLWSRKWLLAAGLVLWSLATLYCGLARSFETLLFARMLVGVGEATMAPCILSLISDKFPESRRGLAMGAFNMGQCVGQGSALFLGGLLLGLFQMQMFLESSFFSQLTPWRWVLVIMGVLSIPFVLGIVFMEEPARTGLGDAETAPRLRFGELWQIFKPVMPIYVALACANICDFAILSWGPLMLEQGGEGSLTISMGIIVIAAAATGALSGGVIADRLRDRGGRDLRLKTAVIVMIAGGLALAYTILFATGLMFLTSLAVWTLCTQTVFTMAMTSLLEPIPGRARGVASSLLLIFAIGFGLTLGASGPGVLVDMVGSLKLSLSLITIPSLIVLVLSYIIADRTNAERLS